jgi:hypothetical protein
VARVPTAIWRALWVSVIPEERWSYQGEERYRKMSRSTLPSARIFVALRINLANASSGGNGSKTSLSAPEVSEGIRISFFS